ncbi:hypothetical protein ASF49_21725 [Methylobacterium sp. Leaf104]|uniref:hypothetical protein n=1 Tax=Methylobacterium TaxID=407 RepID=UPI0006FD528F|nr:MULTISPECIES: hypothetical protein [Methylobacterium]KQP39276.1 hypothetical protein ASF49_21725 [Methylobacterium sp. Leaf104]MCI9882828.1 hypothetical protein [Methylobacterium goesingense]
MNAGRPLLLLCAGLAALGLAVRLGDWRAGYLAAWLALLGLPLGALPLVAGLDALAPERFASLRPALVGCLHLMPVAALLALPLAAVVPALYPFATGTPAATPLAGIWLTLPFLAARLVAALALWLWLCRRVAAGRGPVALALGLHAVLATLVSFDLITALDPRLGSSLIGLLTMAAWSGAALAAALLVTPSVHRSETGLLPLALLTAAWAFLHFVQFLVVWSANLPAEVSWYLARGGPLGRGLSLAGGAAALLAAALTLRPGPWTTRALAASILAVHVVEMAWLVTPAGRGAFVVTGPDVLAGLAIAALAAGLVRLLAPLRARRAPIPDAKVAA